MEDLVALFVAGINAATLAGALDLILERFRQRQRPKRGSTYRETYLVDNRLLHFNFGKERHSKADSSRPPHAANCVSNAAFRFGRRYETDRHFNVSLDNAKIGGEFCDCHDVTVTVSPQTHLNMFPNDFFGA
jgi:hypothetical protein